MRFPPPLRLPDLHLPLETSVAGLCIREQRILTTPNALQDSFAGQIHEHLNGAEIVQGCFDGRQDLLGVPHVALNHERLRAFGLHGIRCLASDVEREIETCNAAAARG